MRICTVLYILMCLVMTGLVPFTASTCLASYIAVDAHRPPAGLAEAGHHPPAPIGLGSTILALLYGQIADLLRHGPRRPAPPVFAKVSPSAAPPWAGTLITAGVAAALARACSPSASSASWSRWARCWPSP